MTRSKAKPKRPVDAVTTAIERERAKRPDGLKPIEIVKVAFSAYQAFFAASAEPEESELLESDDRRNIRHGTQAAMDRLLFNANYWRAAYEDRIVAACSRSEDALACLNALAVWNTHTLRLNTLKPEEVVETFERFCPPFAQNRRRGSGGRAGGGLGPIPDFKRHALEIAEQETPEGAANLYDIIDDLEAEAHIYESLGKTGSLDALFAILPAWCLQDHIELVRGGWWDDCDVMDAIAQYLFTQFRRNGSSEASCQYFLDSFREALDAYQQDISTDQNQFDSYTVPELIALVRGAREVHPGYETDGYGSSLPPWLISKEQLVWNTVVCAIYGPSSTRPLLVESPGQITAEDFSPRIDVITELAETSFTRYTADRIATEVPVGFDSFAELPNDLRNSSIEHIRSIPGKLNTLGYSIVPLGTCYPDQRIAALSTSEVECLAILEHRRWVDERTKAGWSYGEKQSIEMRRSPYLVPWEDLPERAREWNRSAVRNIPALLETVNLAIVR